MRLQIAVLVGTGLLAGCSNGLNTDCQWPVEAASVLHIENKSDAAHVLRDVELAEELSIRFGDERWAPGPARQRGRDEQCFVPLLQHIANLHSVPMQDLLSVRERIGDRGMNLAVNIPIGLVVALLAAFLIRRIDRRFPVSEEPLAIVGATIVSAPFVGGVTLACGGVWEAVFETLRLGNGHLSYRGLRLPWAQHGIEFAAIATAIFVVVSISYFLSCRIRQRNTAPKWHAV